MRIELRNEAEDAVRNPHPRRTIPAPGARTRDISSAVQSLGRKICRGDELTAPTGGARQLRTILPHLASLTAALALMANLSASALADDAVPEPLIPLSDATQFVTARATFGTKFEEHVEAAVPSATGGYFAGGYRREGYQGYEIATIWSVSEGSGKQIWSSRSERSWLHQLWTTPEGFGAFFADGHTLNQVNLLFFDKQGRELRHQTLSRLAAHSYRVLPLKDGGILIIGYSEGNQITRYGRSAWIERLSPDLSSVFSRVFRGGEATDAADAVELPSGDYVIVGSNNRHANTPKQVAWAAKFTRRGKILWQKELPGDQLTRVVRRTDGALIAIGEKEQRLLIAVIDEQGQILKFKIFGDPGPSVDEILALENGNVVVIGRIYMHFKDKPSISESFLLVLDKDLQQKSGTSFNKDPCSYPTAIRSFGQGLLVSADADRPATDPKEMSLPDSCVMEMSLGN